MEKLLHERLREYACPFRSISIIELHEGVTSYAGMFKKWADEIERYYIPRPRFEDGEPVDFHERMGNGKHVRRIIFQEGGWTVDSGKDGAKKYGSYNSGICKTVPRYHEPILDADGVEIKVGDTVYELKNGKKLRIKEADAHHILCAHVDGYGSYEGFDADQLTHERPVFDSIGVRIYKGDTVWHANCQWDVVGIVYHKGEPWVQLDNTNGNPSCSLQERRPETITHHEPDSLEKLRDDMKRNNIDPIPMEINAWVDRLTALIERGK